MATSAFTSLIGDVDPDYDFVHELMNAKFEPYEDGYFDTYFDGLMYLFSLMHLSGNYQVILPATAKLGIAFLDSIRFSFNS